MGLFDAVVGALTQGSQGGAAGAAGGQPDLLHAVAGMLANNSGGGGLGGLVGQFEQAGLGHVIGSWIGNGQNLPISADQLQSVLGSDTVAHIAQQLGLNSSDVAGKLSQLLPQVINQVTPNGQAPAGGLGDLGSLLGSLLKS
ncbi:MAG: DUF937 domain-containing protein [Burkholderiales bacterium]|nr:DUF937 domain-containing protein [Burkholderiales bacterium]MDE2395885.1 DUF937 domain-containing protein [Burkholderiales bacterium]MDE2456657.1 DUF937 domain-containing protein [Burkholderiales bacterium]